MSDQALSAVVEKRGDRQVYRTRAAIRSAFNHLILSIGYDAISAADVAARANVGRSTFYEHYPSKDDLLAESLVAVLEPLAKACQAQKPDPRILRIIEHFWDNRQLAKALLSGRARMIMTRQLAGLIEQSLCLEASSEGSGQTAIPISLVAVQLASGQLALIDEWLSGRYGCSATQIASALQSISSATVDSLKA
jgi:AcrR family transcriptional regulator